MLWLRDHPVSIHALLAECDIIRSGDSRYRRSFNPRTPCGVRPCSSTHIVRRYSFNPRTPCGVRQGGGEKMKTGKRFQSTHSLRSATFYPGFSARIYQQVSIHALLAECDPQFATIANFFIKFQSTHSLRSATGTVRALIPMCRVSIHALLAECDFILISRSINYDGFQSTHSLRSATTSSHPSRQCSIRFNPRTPCGVRHFIDLTPRCAIPFQSTHSLRSATQRPCRLDWRKRVSIHALLAECDGVRPSVSPYSR